MAIPNLAQAQPVDVRIEQGYEWPGEAVFRWSVSQGDLLVVSRSEHTAGIVTGGMGAPVLGVCMPWLRYGPLLARGMFRQVCDPLTFSAWSGVFAERTTLVLDGALPSSHAGVLFMPLPEQCGVFCRPGSNGGTEFGAYGCLPFGAGAAAEAVLVASRPDAQSATDEWFLPRSPFPGGDVTNLSVRLFLNSPSFAFSYSVGGSSAQFAAPGAFTTLWIRGRIREIEGAVLVSGATPEYRAPDGACTLRASRLSASMRVGRDRRRGTLDAGFTFSAAAPAFSPRAEIPTEMALRAALSRDYALAPTRPLSLLLELEKDIRRDSDGIKTETSRCGSTACLSLASMDVAAGVNLSDHDGIGVRGTLSLRPSSRIRIGMEAKGNHLGTSCPGGSMIMMLAIDEGGRRAALRTGVEDFPLASSAQSSAAALAAHFKLSLSCAVRYP